MNPPNQRRRSTDVNSPWYIDAVYKVGIPSAIAVFLIWFLTGEVKSDISVIKESVKIHAEATIHASESIKDQNDRLTYLLLRICVNGAKNETERNACIGK